MRKDQGTIFSRHPIGWTVVAVLIILGQCTPAIASLIALWMDSK